LKQAIQNRARELGFDDCRVTAAAPPERAGKLREWLGAGQHGDMAWLERNAEKRANPQLVLDGARSIVTLAVAYSADRPQPIHDPLPRCDAGQPRGVVARYARFADYHDVMRRKLTALAQFMDELGGPGTRSLWYVDTGPLLERELAERAGLGFVGKHTNLISRTLGNWIFLAEIITTLPLEPDAPERNRCGSCMRCLAACPTGAITAPFTVDARLCISYLTIELKGSIPLHLRPLIGNRIYGCDDCLAVCPWNKFGRAGQMMAAHARGDLEWPALVELLDLDDAAFKKRFAGTPMLRTKRRGILRNVCVALGNTADRRALPALQRALHDPEPLVREHAEWAIAQIEPR